MADRSPISELAERAMRSVPGSCRAATSIAAVSASIWRPSSSVRRYAAQTASDSTVRRRPDSSSWIAAADVPAGDVTMLRSTAGWSPDCFANLVLPSSVSITRSCAMWRGNPMWTAASMSASMTRNT